MKIIIFGANEIGFMLANEFYTDNDITVIDEEKNKVDSFNKLDIGFIAGNASSIEILKQAGIKDTDVFIACNHSDELNIVACLNMFNGLSKSLKKRRIQIFTWYYKRC